MFDLFSKPKIYFTADLHFGHKNVIPYCNRPFADLESMHKEIIKVWNTTVRPKDTIYVLGDFSLNPKWSREIIPNLNGYKILVAGNHDTCHISNKKCNKFIDKYLVEWDEVYSDYHRITLKDNSSVLLCHLPYPPKNNEYDLRYMEYRPQNKGSLLLHGHLHGRYIKDGRQIDVSWDAHNGKIISEDNVINLIEDEREFIPSHITEFYSKRTKDSPG